MDIFTSFLHAERKDGVSCSVRCQVIKECGRTCQCAMSAVRHSLVGVGRGLIFLGWGSVAAAPSGRVQGAAK